MSPEELPTSFEVDYVVRELAATVRVVGEFDVASSPEFDRVIGNVPLADLTSVEVDLAGVSLLDSSALGSLIRFRNSAERHEVEFAVNAPALYQRRLFAITGLSEVLGVRGGFSPQPDV